MICYCKNKELTLKDTEGYGCCCWVALKDLLTSVKWQTDW